MFKRAHLRWLMILGSLLWLSACRQATTTQIVTVKETVIVTQQVTTLVEQTVIVTTNPQPTAVTALTLPTPLPTATADLPSPTPLPTAVEGSASPPPTSQPSPTQPAIPTQLPSPTLAAANECTDIAAFYGDITVPDGTFFYQGDRFTKTWRIKNEGTCTWTTAYRVVHHSGEPMSAALSQVFTSEVPPGGLVNISIDLTAPTRGGPQQSHWWFEDASGQRFGTGITRNLTIFALINVRYLDQNDQPPGDPGSQPPLPPPEGCAAQQDAGVEAEVLALLNQVRTQNGLLPLSLSPQLSAAALVHSRDMACNHFVDHSGSDSSSWYDRIRAQGYTYTAANENIYVGFPQFGGTAQGAVDWWMNSQIHRENILSRNTQVGIGFVYDANSDWGGYYTTVFARP